MPRESTPPTVDADRQYTAEELGRILGVHRASIENHCTPIRVLRFYTLDSVAEDLRAANIRTSRGAA